MLGLLDVLPKFRARIFGIQLRQLSQDFLRAFIAGQGDGSLDLNDLISACAFLGGRWNALLAEPKLLAGLGSRRNLEHGAAIDGGNLHLCAECRFRNTHGNGEVNIVAFAMENGMVVAAHFLYPGDAKHRYFVEEIGVVKPDGIERFFTWDYRKPV